MWNRIKTMDAGNVSSSRISKDQSMLDQLFALKSQVLQPAYIQDPTEMEKINVPVRNSQRITTD